MKLAELQRNWELFGTRDPLWAILADPEYKDNKWDLETFFASGREQVDRIFDRLDSIGIKPSPRRALDFGCGVGRLTQALCTRFARVEGVDLAPAMISLANTHNRHPKKCSYSVNDRETLRFEDASFDLVLTRFTLQHMQPAYAMAYLREFVRILAPGGVAVFDLPSRLSPTLSLVSRLKRHLIYALPAPLRKAYRRCRYGRRPIMEMYAVDRTTVERVVTESGATIRDVLPDCGAGREWESYMYFIERPLSSG